MSDLNIKKRGGRNGLIELYRFLFALNVVKNHGFMPGNIKYFAPGRVSVEFFFILSGYFFVRSLDRLGDMPLTRSLAKLLVGKIKPLFIPLGIGLISNVICNIAEGEIFSGIWGYLWYVKSMLVTFVVYLVLRRLVRSEKAFFYVTVGACTAATLMRFSGFFYEWGLVRAFSTISLGMILSKAPTLKLKRKWPIVAALIPVQLGCLCIVAHELGNVDWFGGFRGIELILDFVLYPALIYLTLQLEVNSPFLAYLGALSFGLYAFQCPADLIRTLGVANRYVLLSVIVALTLIEDGAKRVWRIRAKKTKNDKDVKPKEVTIGA